MTLVAISSEVNSSSKFPTSKVPVKTGIKGASNFLASKASKSNPWKKGWALISSKPLLTPSLLSCFLINNFVYFISMWLLGISIIGLPIIYIMIFLKSFKIGFTVSSIFANYKFLGILGIICYLIPVLLYIKAYGKPITYWKNLIQFILAIILCIIGVTAGILTIIDDVTG